MVNYLADNGTFKARRFIDEIRNRTQLIRYCGVNAHHKNGCSERSIRTVTEMSRAMILLAPVHWKDQAGGADALAHGGRLHSVFIQSFCRMRKARRDPRACGYIHWDTHFAIQAPQHRSLGMSNIRPRPNATTRKEASALAAALLTRHVLGSIAKTLERYPADFEFANWQHFAAKK
jgi:hypothetical protein